ncbi:hypothetical protein D3C87_1345800 [compost metagenome]
MFSENGIKPFQMLHQTAEQRQLLLDRNVFAQYLLKALRQPTDRGSTGTGFARVNVGPTTFAQAVQQTEPSHQPLKGFTLIQGPRQPDADP